MGITYSEVKPITMDDFYMLYAMSYGGIKHNARKAKTMQDSLRPKFKSVDLGEQSDPIRSLISAVIMRAVVDYVRPSAPKRHLKPLVRQEAFDWIWEEEEIHLQDFQSRPMGFKWCCFHLDLRSQDVQRAIDELSKKHLPVRGKISLL
jgi:hypothetical protein